MFSILQRFFSPSSLFTEKMWMFYRDLFICCKISVNFTKHLQEKQQHFMYILCDLKAKFKDFLWKLQNLCKCANLLRL